MYRTVRYPDPQTALRVGIDLDMHYQKDWLTGLNFIVEPEGSVIVHAVWTDQYKPPGEHILNAIMEGGTTETATPEELFTFEKPGHIYFLGDGLEAFKLFIENRYPREDPGERRE